eukprot:530829-Rhodomonas_salina.1
MALRLQPNRRRGRGKPPSSVTLMPGRSLWPRGSATLTPPNASSVPTLIVTLGLQRGMASGLLPPLRPHDPLRQLSSPSMLDLAGCRSA